jgi:hypothetical protein
MRVNHDTNSCNYWHHFGNFNWDDITCQWAQIAGDCVDLNTENPAVDDYIVKCYSQFIKLGCDGFRIDTGRHINRLVFNKVFNDAFLNYAKADGNNSFFMFAEVCTRDRNVIYRNTPPMSTPYYTWKDSKDYAWSTDRANGQTSSAHKALKDSLPLPTKLHVLNVTTTTIMNPLGAHLTTAPTLCSTATAITLLITPWPMAST